MNNQVDEVHIVKFLVVTFFALGASACSTTLSPDVVPVSNFNSEKYLGKWYEVARIENGFEEGLSKVTAEYSRREGGGITVLNRGFEAEDNEWEEAKGKAFFVDTEEKGHLKVSFFGPFYGPYVIFELAPDYSYSFVTNHNKKYLWLLSRTPEISDETRTLFIKRIKEMNFDTDELVWVDH